MGLAPFSSCKMADLCPAPCWLIGFAGFRQQQVCRDPFLATAFMLELQLWQPVMASWIIWLKNWVAGQAKRISYISAPHPSLLLSCHLNCPSLDCVDSCSAGSLIWHWLSRAFGIATFLVCLTFSRFLLFLAQVYTSPISRVCLMAYSLHTGHSLVSVHRLASCPTAVTGVLQPPSQSCQFGLCSWTACAFTLVDLLVFMMTLLGVGACSLWGKQVPWLPSLRSPFFSKHL